MPEPTSIRPLTWAAAQRAKAHRLAECSDFQVPIVGQAGPAAVSPSSKRELRFALGQRSEPVTGTAPNHCPISTAPLPTTGTLARR